MLEQGAIKTQSTQVAVVLAALNEEQGIGPTIQEIKTVLPNPHLIVVDGNSEDQTAKIAKSLVANVLLQKGVGKGDAMVQGVENLNSTNRYVVFTDADFTYPAECIPKMVKF
jgi:dolichol-phosphate mannosyltransferase